MLRVDWQQEAVDAGKRSLAMQTERLLQHPSSDLTDVENTLEGIPENSSSPGTHRHQLQILWTEYVAQVT